MEYSARLKRDFPNISDAIVAQILGSIPGVDLGNLQRLLFEGGERGLELEYEMAEDGSGRVNTIVKTGLGRGESAGKRAPDSQTSLSAQDLAVLKRVPGRHRDQPKSA